MDNKNYTVEHVSNILGIHAKTTRRYIREGKLRAGKIGNSYRISGHDLSTFTEAHGVTLADDTAQPAIPAAKISVSAVVDIAATGEQADRISAMVLAAANSRGGEMGERSVNIQQTHNGANLRVMLWGGTEFVSAMIESIGVYETLDRD